MGTRYQVNCQNCGFRKELNYVGNMAFAITKYGYCRNCKNFCYEIVKRSILAEQYFDPDPSKYAVRFPGLRCNCESPIIEPIEIKGLEDSDESKHTLCPECHLTPLHFEMTELYD